MLLVKFVRLVEHINPSNSLTCVLWYTDKTCLISIQRDEKHWMNGLMTSHWSSGHCSVCAVIWTKFRPTDPYDHPLAVCLPTATSCLCLALRPTVPHNSTAPVVIFLHFISSFTLMQLGLLLCPIRGYCMPARFSFHVPPSACFCQRSPVHERRPRLLGLFVPVQSAFLSCAWLFLWMKTLGEAEWRPRKGCERNAVCTSLKQEPGQYSNGA